KSLRKKQVIDFRGNRIMISPSIKFDIENNRLRLTIFPKEKSKPQWYWFSGIGSAKEGVKYKVSNPHGEKFLGQNLQKIMEVIKSKKGKSKYAYVIRKQIAEENDKPIYDYYLQYTIETQSPLKKSYDGVLGLDIGSSKIATAVLLTKNNGTKPSLVKFFRGEPLITLKIRRRKQLYFLRNSHNRRRKVKRIRRIEPKINQILHIVSKQIVELAQKNNALIAIEKLEKPKKKRYKQYRKEKYLLSLFSFKKLSDLISYKAKREGINVVNVNPEGTSYTCSHCGSTNTIRPYKSTYSLIKCNNEKCGVELNADYNAAFNIAKKALNSLNI
ncbi:MAG: RNA-guided endonuclease TnpB family protein, partial [Candidatus Aenigmatarchaeota archaeon]